MCVSFHPVLPAVIAGGTFNGEIRVWNTGSSGEPLLASSGFSELVHKEPISKVLVARYCLSSVQAACLGDLDP